MTITTKSNLADELSISRARVSQYCRDGMPVRSDGRLNRDEALNWVKSQPVNRDGEDKGSARAAKLVRAGKPPRETPSAAAKPSARPRLPAAYASADAVGNDVDRGAVLMGLWLTYKLPATSASLAFAAGAPLRTCYALHTAMKLAALTEATDALVAFGGAEVGEEDKHPRVDPRAFDEVDWSALAAQRGERADVPAWEEWSRTLFAGDEGAAAPPPNRAPNEHRGSP